MLRIAVLFSEIFIFKRLEFWIGHIPIVHRSCIQHEAYIQINYVTSCTGSICLFIGFSLLKISCQTRIFARNSLNSLTFILYFIVDVDWILFTSLFRLISQMIKLFRTERERYEHSIRFECCRKRKGKREQIKNEIKTWFIRNDQSVLSDREWHNYLVQLSSAALSLVESGKRQPMKPIDCMGTVCNVQCTLCCSITYVLFLMILSILCSAYSPNVCVELKRIAALSIGWSADPFYSM